MQLNGRQGIHGWRWIFIIEGALTVALGIGAYWVLVDFPDQAHRSWNFLNEREIRFIINRVDKDRGDARVERFSWAKFFRAGLDIKIWGYAMVSIITMMTLENSQRTDLFQHHHRHLRTCVLLTCHPYREHGLLSRCLAMSRWVYCRCSWIKANPNSGSAVRVRSNCDVYYRLYWRQV